MTTPAAKHQHSVYSNEKIAQALHFPLPTLPSKAVACQRLSNLVAYTLLVCDETVGEAAADGVAYAEAADRSRRRRRPAGTRNRLPNELLHELTQWLPNGRCVKIARSDHAIPILPAYAMGRHQRIWSGLGIGVNVRGVSVYLSCLCV